MRATNDGGPAFPVPGEGSWDDPTTCKIRQRFDGLSKREWFAGMALQGLCASRWGGLQKTETFAAEAVVFAEAMLAALSEKGCDQ